MSQTDSLLVKICISSGNGSSEVHLLELSPSIGFEDLTNRITALCGPHRLSWLDTEEDYILVNSDESLRLAFSQMDGRRSSIRFHVNTRPLNHHRGLRCHGCKYPILGFRYKCLTCPNYEQCATCENSGSHEQHRFIRISKQEDKYSKSLFKLLNKCVASYDRENEGVHEMLNKFWSS
eukprot:TRINITY_DN1958_c0_g1_i1.p1 TRINITY_DN1958_c0_g1~~TRINITY_DN1958_c0_g1_i1.p1  ORF type:complete len:185 (-),score=17.33 TRINITY_DN1958_c0_g1_i1:29-562(-)